MSFEYLQGRRHNDLSGKPAPVFDHPHSKNLFPDVQMEPPVFRFVPIVSGPVTGHHRKEPGSLFFAPPIKHFTH